MNRRAFLLGAAAAPLAPVLLNPGAQAASIPLAIAGQIIPFTITGGQVVSTVVFRADSFTICKGQSAGPTALPWSRLAQSFEREVGG